jgi:hypothetical protein
VSPVDKKWRGFFEKPPGTWMSFAPAKHPTYKAVKTKSLAFA